MWSSKMAARWRGDVVNLNAGNGDFVSSNSSSEFVLSRRHMEGGEEETQSCMDQSILAIFEDSPVSSEDRGGVEEENEKLLSALTEMLDSVEDDDGTLSPFDTVPDTKLLTQTDPRNISEEPSLADRLRPRSKLSNETFPVKIREEKKAENRIEKNGLPKVFKQPRGSSFNTRTNKKREAELDVFTSATLVNLVKLMHPYCLKLHVEEEGDKLRRNHTFFSQEEVWKYERPTEDSHEEIDVVSDEEATVKMTNEGEGVRDLGKHLKSALLKRNSSREKKRVSFGPVEVASLDGSSEMHLSKKNMKSSCTSETVDTQALEDSPDSACEAEMSAEMNIDKKVVVPHKSPTKARSLSLQQYRQLRQQRQPLVEKQGNYTTKWPSVPHTPLELTPILCLQGQRLGTSRSEPSHHHLNDGRSYADQLQRSVPPGHASHLTSARPHFKEAKPSTPPQYCKPKRPRTESKAPSPASPLPSNPVNPNLVALESKTSPVKLPTPASSDPPNPVLLTLPVSRTSSPSKDQTASGPDVESPTESNPDSTSSHFHEIQYTSNPGTSLELQTCLSGPNSEMTPGNEEDSASFQDIQSRLTKIVSGDISRSQALCTAATLVQPSTSSEKAQPVECTLNPGPKTPSCQSLTGPTILVKERLAEVLHPKTLPVEPLPTAAVSGIEATDLTSLLEQFEETQAKQKKAEPFMELLTSRPPSDSPRPPNILRDSVDLQTPEAAQVPEPLGNEIILSAQQDLPARRKNAPSKAIQIIDPRPLPSKKTHSNLSERPNVLTSPHLFSSISSDHDYCGPADRFLAHIPQCVRSSKSKDSSKITESLPDIKRQTESKQHTSSDRVLTSVTTTDIPSFGTQHLPAESRNGPETAPSTDMLLTLSHSVAMEPTCKSAAKHKVVPCTLPTPPPSPPARGRDRRRHRRSSPRSDSSSSSCSSSPSSSSSCSPSPKRRQHKHSESSSCSSSPSRSVSQSPPQRNRWSRSRRRCSRSRSRSWSQSRSPSRSPPPLNNCRQWRDIYNSRKSRRLRREHELRIQKLKAIDERRVVYVGRICRSMTHDELRERFSQFGEVECVSLHFRERGDHYGFVTFYNMNDAFAAIDNGSKLRRPDELPFDLCFGGRRQFCNSDYADLDANRDADLSPARSKFEDLDFDQLLKQAQRGMNR